MSNGGMSVQQYDDDNDAAYSSSRLFSNFMIMTVGFSVNHATVTAMVALASANLGSELGNLQTALLYSFYTLTALFASKSIVGATGWKYGIVAGLGLYVAYVASFIVADQTESPVRDVAACIGGTLGGIAAGFLWTAQFAYFGRNAAMWAMANRDKLMQDKPAEVQTDGEIDQYVKDKASGMFAAYFAVPYLGFEVVFKMMQTVIGTPSGPVSAGWSSGKTFIYVINTCCAVAATVMCVFILDLKEERKKADVEDSAVEPENKSSFLDNVLSAGRLAFSDPKMVLMMNMNFCFGFAAAYINGYITGPVVTTYIGAGYGGILAAITAAVAALLSLPNTLGWVPAGAKKYYMVGGPLCFALVGFLPIVVGYGKIGHWAGGWGLILFYVLQGLGRGVWESTNKAIFVDYFSYDKMGAGSNLIIQNGLASAVAFFVNAFSSASPTVADCAAQGDCPVYAAEAWVVVATSVMAVVGFLLASGLNSKGIKTWAQIGGTSDLQQPLIEN